MRNQIPGLVNNFHPEIASNVALSDREKEFLKQLHMGKAQLPGGFAKAAQKLQGMTESYEEYKAKAIELATKPELLEKLKEKLERNRVTKPLFNTKKITTIHIE